MAYNKEAQDKYRQKCKTKTVVLFPTDADIAAYAEQINEPFSTLVKRLIREEMARQKAQEPQNTDS